MGGELKKVPARFYRNPSGAEPVRNWLHELGKEDRKEIGKDVATVEYGWPIGMPACAPLGAGRTRCEPILPTTGLPGSSSASPGAPWSFCTDSSRNRDRRRSRIWSLQDKDNVRWNVKHEPVGSSFDSFLEEEGIREEVEGVAQKRVFAWQIQQAMEASGITQSELAGRMRTSRSQVARLLDPNNTAVQLDTLQRAAHAVGRELKLELV